MAVGRRLENCRDVSLIGTGAMDLENLESEDKVVEIVPIEEAQCEVKVACQWIDSKLGFYERHLKLFRRERSNQSLTLVSLTNERDEVQLDLFGPPSLSDKQQDYHLSIITVISTAITKPNEFVNWSVDRIMFSVNANDFDKCFQVLVILATALTCLGSFTRVLFLDTMIDSFIFWCNNGMHTGITR